MVDIATRVYNHTWKIDPIVRSVIDTDFYKLLMAQTIFRRHRDAAVTFGIASDTPAPGDYDGDGKTDVAVFRAAEGNWYWLQNSNAAFRVANWGTAQDLAVPATNVP